MTLSTRFTASRRRMVLVAIALLGSLTSFAVAADRSKVVVADFDFIDTSGEIANQSVDHKRRLATFANDLITMLSDDRRFAAQRLACRSVSCSVNDLGPDDLIVDAKAQDARYLVYGGVHKASTLVEWMKMEMVDLRSGRLLASKLITFRGDSDDAYRHAASFAADTILHDTEFPR